MGRMPMIAIWASTAMVRKVKTVLEALVSYTHRSHPLIECGGVIQIIACPQYAFRLMRVRMRNDGLHIFKRWTNYLITKT